MFHKGKWKNCVFYSKVYFGSSDTVVETVIRTKQIDHFYNKKKKKEKKAGFDMYIYVRSVM